MQSLSFGVSPAYFVSRYGEGFSAAEVAGSLPDLSALGFTGFQLEVYRREALEGWRNGGSGPVRDAADRLEMKPGAFVAHYLIDGFRDPAALRKPGRLDSLTDCLEVLELFPECTTVTIPMPPFQAPGRLSAEDVTAARQQLAATLRAAAEMVEDTGRRLALEVLPGCLVGGLDGLLRLAEQFEIPGIGLHLDTGHAVAAGESPALVAATAADRLYATHLCERRTPEPLAMEPRAGGVDWPALFATLLAVGYDGGLDIEIVSPPDRCAETYGRSVAFLTECLAEAGRSA